MGFLFYPTFLFLDGLTVPRMVFSGRGRGSRPTFALSVGVSFHRGCMLTFNILYLHLENPRAFFSDVLLALFQLRFEFLDTATRNVVLGFQVGQFRLHDAEGIYDMFLMDGLAAGTRG